jgi:hypothetical protein
MEIDNKREVGRPSKYTPELQSKFDEMVNGLYSDDVKTAFDNYFKYGILEQICLFLDLNLSSVYKWSDHKDDGFKPEFSKTLNKWYIITKALVHVITPAMASKAPAMAIFLRKTKLGELEVTKHILETKIQDSLKVEGKTKMEIDLMADIEDARLYGMDEGQIAEVEALLIEVQKTRSIAKAGNNGSGE